MSFNITRLRYSEIISGQFFVKSNSNLIPSTRDGMETRIREPQLYKNVHIIDYKIN